MVILWRRHGNVAYSAAVHGWDEKTWNGALVHLYVSYTHSYRFYLPYFEILLICFSLILCFMLLLLLLFLLEEPIDPSGVLKGALIVWRWYVKM